MEKEPMISYDPLWKTLVDKHMNKGELCEAAHLSKGTVTKMGKGESVTLDVIARICGTIHVPIQDVVEIKEA